MKILTGSEFYNLSGSVGDYVICQTKDGPILRRKPTYSKSKRANAPNFERVGNNAEFGRAGKAVKLIRNAFSPLLKNAKDAKLTPRLQAVNGHGYRNAADGNLCLLKSFDCNIHCPLQQILFSGYSVQLNRPAGNVQLTIPFLVPDKHLKYPTNATHFRVIYAVSEIDFAGEDFKTEESNSRLLPIKGKAGRPLVLNISIRPGSELPLIVALGIQFFQGINEVHIPVENRNFNPLSFVEVEKG